LKKDLIEIVNSHEEHAIEIFAKLDRVFRGKNGINRGSYSHYEEKAHNIVRKFATELGLRVSEDHAGNSYYFLPDLKYDSDIVITGSHLDSQPNAGNYDGAAGVISGIIALSALLRLDRYSSVTPIAMAFRGEETSGWFKGNHRGHIGSRAALGTLESHELDEAIHILDGRPLRNHLLDLEIIAEKIIHPSFLFDTNNVREFIELHIEQGPVLTSKNIPVGIVSGIRGNFRARNAFCCGEYSHSGGVPTKYRRDAVIASAKFVVEMDNIRKSQEKEGKDMVYATGKFFTNSEIHALSKVPREVFFTIDVRSIDEYLLDSMKSIVQRIGANISSENNVEFNFGEFSSTKPAMMNPSLIKELIRGCTILGIPHVVMPSGGGHDAVEFSHVNIPSSMIFIRNENNSHNPEESIQIEDFLKGTQLLTWFISKEKK
jgi:N-carbamoyl-L-amino-acid hydrolase